MLLAEELIYTITTAGGVLELSGDKVKYRLPGTVAHLAAELRERKPEIINLLRKAGDRLAYFPACTRCGAYCLNREDSGPFECLRCGERDILEYSARIAGFLAESRSPARVM